ncbi:MAG TPA: alkyl sulfatase dimerization domain-containing protein [Methylomirabilota bacterium]|nr:alkyl sulfatase dimerization domain-containing protein [Methylomirabilota bacterium]
MTADPARPPTPAREATSFTAAANRAVLDALPFGDRQDFEDAARGFLGTLPDVEIKHAQGRVIWSLRDYAFLAAEAAPPTVNPSLWRQARLNLANGLYQVTAGLYQVRGFDISNMTLIEGERGVIVVDPLISTETARAALALYREHRGPRPVTAVIYTHSHVDHYGGVRGVVEEADVRAGRVPVLAPDGFMEEVVSENVLAGTPMMRRAQFQFGATLSKGPRGQVDAGLGKVTSRGTVTLIPPTHVIAQPYETHVLDGVEIVFQLAPETEAPAEMHMFYPALRALNLAENATHNLHNTYPIRGAQVRDANAWAKYLDAALDRFGDDADVVFAQHHWPVWGRERVADFLARQRDLYKYLHDQTVRLMNHGWKSAEIAERLALPPGLAETWHVRGYYGTLSHNAKAVYQRYLGWYDANPANLAPLPPVERAKKYVEYMGGAAAARERARADFERGEYRFVAEAMSHLVFADPADAEARGLAADAFEQLGYQAESATWRNAYLLGAHELRGGTPSAAARAPVSPDVVRAMPLDLFFDYLAVRLDGERAQSRAFTINWVLTDTDERYTLTLARSALTYRAGRQRADAAATVRLARPVLDRLVLRELTLEAALAGGAIVVEGERARLAELFELLDDFALMFPVVEPRRETEPAALDSAPPRP